MQPAPTVQTPQQVVNYQKNRTGAKTPPPAPEVNTATPVVDVVSNHALPWSLITSLERTPGYRWPLYQFLQAAHVAGKPLPKAQAVLNDWKLKPPPGLRVVQSGKRDALEYQLDHGGVKTADLRAIQSAINGLIV